MDWTLDLYQVTHIIETNQVHGRFFDYWYALVTCALQVNGRWASGRNRLNFGLHLLHVRMARQTFDIQNFATVFSFEKSCIYLVNERANIHHGSWTCKTPVWKREKQLWRLPRKSTTAFKYNYKKQPSSVHWNEKSNEYMYNLYPWRRTKKCRIKQWSRTFVPITSRTLDWMSWSVMRLMCPLRTSNERCTAYNLILPKNCSNLVIPALIYPKHFQQHSENSVMTR